MTALATTKRCTRCRAEKPLEEFSRKAGSSDGRNYSCKACNNEKVKRWREGLSPERRAAMSARNTVTERVRRYGVPAEEFDRLVAEQGGGCAICGDPRSLCLDHDHVTGAVRGVLCRQCNSAIGKLGDSVEGLERAIAYLTPR